MREAQKSKEIEDGKRNTVSLPSPQPPKTSAENTLLFFTVKPYTWADAVAQVVQHLPQLEALSSNPSTTKKKKERIKEGRKPAHLLRSRRSR
jgi:hypothetical protein